MTDPPDTDDPGKNKELIQLVLSVLELSKRELGGDSRKLLVSRDFANTNAYYKSIRYLKTKDYIVTSRRGTFIPLPNEDINGLIKCIEKEYNTKLTAKLPKLSHDYLSKHKSHKSKPGSSGKRPKLKTVPISQECEFGAITLFGKTVPLNKDTLIFST